MLIIDKPYISNFLIETIKKNKFSVLENEFSSIYRKEIGPYLLNNEEFISKFRASKNPKLYTSSENSIGWISNNLEYANLPEKINLFKNKTKFRELTALMYPDFYFQETKIANIDKINFDELPLPFIIKPSTGFFSMGVYKVNNKTEWEQTKKNILVEIKKTESLYPTEVLDTNNFIIEECIEGEEFAFDAYFDELGKPVLLNAFKHYFASSNDVSDRVYYTSKEIIEAYYLIFTDFMIKIAELAKVKNFPVHVEVRINKEGQLIPIEINPLRFGGWCTTADLTFHAFGFNPYEYFFKSQKPDWKTILAQTNDSLYSIIVLDNSTGQDAKTIKSFDYDRLSLGFSTILEIRKVNYKEYPVFGFLFVETRFNAFSELEKISRSKLTEYINV
ncbi:MAG: ATP-grasp domain-containing protein [Paludibacter sp.]|nr:ATP-grasp domain-containing protein [Paludibacter sp.]